MVSMIDNNTFAEFYAHLERRDLSIHAKRAYLIDLAQFKQFFEEIIGETFTITAITEYDVIAWRDHLVSKKYRPASINRKLASLRAWFSWGIQTRLIPSNPTQYVHGIKTQPRAPKSLDPHQTTKMLRKAAQGRYKRDLAVLETMFGTGLRAGEIVRLKIEDIEIRERSGWMTVHGKGRKFRSVPINAHLRRILSDYIGDRTTGPVFLTEHGYTRGISYQTVRRIVRTAAQQAGIPDVTPHSTRHTVATRLVRDPEVDLITVATLLGHERLETLMIYAQPTDEDLEAAADRL